MQRSPCTLCDHAAVAPTASTEWLVQDSHEGAGIAQCGCGNLWLHFWVEIFDDLTHYWAPLSAQDAELVRTQAGSGGVDELLDLVRRIVRARTVLMDGTARTEWVAGEHAMLSGPPW